MSETIVEKSTRWVPKGKGFECTTCGREAASREPYCYTVKKVTARELPRTTYAAADPAGDAVIGVRTEVACSEPQVGPRPPVPPPPAGKFP